MKNSVLPQKIIDTKTTLQLPEDLPEGTKLQVNAVQDMTTPGLEQVGEMYQFIFTYPAGFEDYTGDVILTMGVNQNKENTAIYHHNEETHDWEYVGGDIENEIITAIVHNFSIYGVLREEVVVTEPGREDTTDQTPIEIDNDESKRDLENRETKDDQPEETLPKTATNSYNWLFVGLLIVILAIFIWQVDRKRKRAD